ncbi:DUF456 domain-containing protein [Desulfofalx alkaliphila]|uniref:DUF456 domain-containing protein n=1 Tax=Desulfofalx alkaliphila TaxID=105483 RepID=UPI0004E20755|nr:DUF456 family protein [Desulfofalx alkaliphila]
MDWLALTAALAIMLIGMAGAILPVIPGAPLILLGMVVYGLISGFTVFSWHFWLGQVILVILAFAVDYVAGIVGVKRYGGSKAAVWGSILGAFGGLFLLGPLGIILGPFLGAIIGELLHNKSPKQAINAGIGTLLGFAGGTVVKLIIQTAMIVSFLLVVL